MTNRIERRQALRILGAAAALPAGVIGLRSLSGTPVPVRWHGEALGGLAGMTLWHPDPDTARRAISRMQTEVERLENVFSLYRGDSEISRLNRDGRITSPSRDLVFVLDESRRIAEASKGAFDPTIQPLWRLYAARAAAGSGGASKPDEWDLDAARALVDYAALSANRKAVRFDRPGMAVSLNGIAQGYITDRIAELLGNEGFEHAVIELGETRAIGSNPDGQPFTIGLVNPGAPNRADREIGLANAALSVSGGYGHPLDDHGTHHIFDPASGQSANRLSDVAVIAPKAIWADALSTAIFVAGELAAPALLSEHPSARAILTRHDGQTIEI